MAAAHGRVAASAQVSPGATASAGEKVVYDCTGAYLEIRAHAGRQRPSMLSWMVEDGRDRHLRDSMILVVSGPRS